MKILDIKSYLDGGTVEVMTDRGLYCFDCRLKSDTKGRLFRGYPKDDNTNIIEDDSELESNIISALEFYKKDKFYKEEIKKIVSLKQ